MEGMIMTAQLLLSLSILVTVHEWGHFITARMFNIKVEKFYIFFDFLFPMTNVLNFSLLKYKHGDTEYGIGWFPLGGYVKIAGMVDESMDEEQIKSPPQPWEFRSKPAWQRMIVMLGGIIVNVIVGVIIFVSMVYGFGDTYIPNDYVNQHGGIHAMELAERIGLKTGDKIIKVNDVPLVNFNDVLNPDSFFAEDPHYTVLRDNQEVEIDIPSDFMENFNQKNASSLFVAPRIPAVVESVLKGTLADQLGLQKNDRFIEVNGRPVNYQDELRQAIKENTSDSLFFTVERASNRLSFNAQLGDDKMIGFHAQGIDKNELAHIDYSLGGAIALGTERAFGVIFLQLQAFKKIFSGDVSLRKSLSGPIGMAQTFGSEWNWKRFWRMTGLLSMVLAFMNLLPIPALDGGHAVFLLYEMIVGREVPEKFSVVVLKIGMALLLLLMVFVFYNDIARLISG